MDEPFASAYFKTRPDTTRAQLPVKEDFDEIKHSIIPFVFLGQTKRYEKLPF